MQHRRGPSWTVPSVDGVEVAVHELGGDGPPLLVAHATGFLGAVYEPMAMALRERYRVVALDARGHGWSTRPEGGDFDWARAALDVLAVADHLGPAPLAGFGHSFGGATLLLAEHERPGTFGRLVLYEPIVFPDDVAIDGPSPLAGSARNRRPVFADREEARQRYAARPPLSAMRADVLERYVGDGFVDQSDGTVRLRCAPQDEAATFESALRVRTSTISDVATRITVVVGAVEEAEPNPARFAPGLVAALAHADLRTQPDAGHLGPFERPEAVAATVLNALGDR